MPLSDSDCRYWFELAERDAESAEILRREKGPAEISAYHYHQAAEKLFKGAILRSGRTFPFIHDLQRLYGILRDSDPNLPNIAEAVVDLQSAYGSLRYPRGDRLSAERLENIREAYRSIAAAIRR